MGVFDVGRCTVCIGVMVVFAACGGPSSQAGVPGVGAVTPGARTPAKHQRSWMLPEAKSDMLLYYTDGSTNIYVLSYPRGKLVGTLTGLDTPQGVCSDARGNVFVTTRYTEDIFEYAHGGTQPIAKLGDFGYYPLGCSVDPITGNLAVANIEAMDGTPGNVAIYAGAAGKPTDYTVPGIYGFDWCTYDAAGNLYANGGTLAEMPYDSQSFTKISLDVTGEGIRWDGQYLAMVDPSSLAVYRVAITGSSGTVVDTVHFTGLFTHLGNDFALQGKKIVAPYGNSQHYYLGIGLWKYPRGGKLQNVLHRSDFVYDLTLSV